MTTDDMTPNEAARADAERLWPPHQTFHVWDGRTPVSGTMFGALMRDGYVKGRADERARSVARPAPTEDEVAQTISSAVGGWNKDTTTIRDVARAVMALYEHRSRCPHVRCPGDALCCCADEVEGGTR